MDNFSEKVSEFEPDFILDGGDSVDGSASMHKGMWKHQNYIGFFPQLFAYSDIYPKFEAKTYRINGNHDLSFLKYEKIDVGKEIIKLRKDIIHMGDEMSDFFVNNTKIRICHPNSGDYRGPSSKKLNSIIDDYDDTTRPDILHISHYHQMLQSQHLDVWAFLNGTFQDSPAYGNFYELSDLGSWLIKFEQDESGKVVDLVSRFVCL